MTLPRVNSAPAAKGRPVPFEEATSGHEGSKRAQEASIGRKAPVLKKRSAEPAPRLGQEGKQPHETRSESGILHLQRAAGNQAVARLLTQRIVEAKMRAIQPTAAPEIEADRIAEQVTRAPERNVFEPGMPSKAGVSVRSDQQAINLNATRSSADANSLVFPAMGGGAPLDESSRRFFEPRFDRDLTNVRIHTGPAASRTAQLLNARAFTTGSDIAFAAGEHSPNIEGGRKLIAHELAHVVAQETSPNGAASLQCKRKPNTPAAAAAAKAPEPSRATIDPQDYLTFEEFAAAWPDLVTSFESLRSLWNRQTRAGWTERALGAAGIDLRQWNPGKGFPFNVQNINKVYEYYARLYLGNSKLRWAAMAKLAGGEVFRGLQDELQPMVDFGRALDDHDPTTLGPGDLYELYGSSIIQILLEMQKDIFLDLAWQHQAYVEGGIRALDVAWKRGELSDANHDAWLMIDAGNEDQIWEGNRLLLLREQSLVLQGGQEYLTPTGSMKVQSFRPHYQRIKDLPDFDFIPASMSEEAKSPVPKGKEFGEVVPGGDITDFKDRWKWIETDMLPAFKKLDKEELKRLVSLPVKSLATRPF